MEIELKEIRDFIAHIPPLDRLPLTTIDTLTENIAISYIRRKSAFPPTNISEQRLYLIRKGALSHFSADDILLEKLGEGDLYTNSCFNSKQQEPNNQSKIAVDEDTLLYTIPCDLFKEIVSDHPKVLTFIKTSASKRLKSVINEIQDQASNSSSLMYTIIEDILHADVVSVESGKSISEAAIEMSKQNVSSILVMKDQKLVGILTDKDFRERCIATGLSVKEPVDKIMTSNVLTIPSQTLAFDALMLMTRKHIHHLPVCDDDELKGIVNITDFMRTEGKNSAYLSSAHSQGRFN